MRELSKAEMTAVSGGQETVTVHGTRPPQGSTFTGGIFIASGSTPNGDSTFYDENDDNIPGDDTVYGFESSETKDVMELYDDPNYEAHFMTSTTGGPTIIVFIAIDGSGFWYPNGSSNTYTWYGPPAVS